MKQKRETSQGREKKKPNTVRLVIVGVLAVAAAGVAVALTVSSDDLSPPPVAPGGVGLVTAPGAVGGEVPAPPGVTDPAPYQYHAATNRHYDPYHAHWHAGPPPAEGNRVASSGTQVPAPPGITNPTPYQYDAATDRHYDPQHAHWHGGPPPQ